GNAATRRRRAPASGSKGNPEWLPGAGGERRRLRGIGARTRSAGLLRRRRPHPAVPPSPAPARSGRTGSTGRPRTLASSRIEVVGSVAPRLAVDERVVLRGQ